MKILLSCILLSLWALISHAQSPTWSTTKNWKIYAGEGQQVFTYPIDTLKFLPCMKLNSDTLQQFLTKAQTLALDRTPTWMGSYLASYELPNGQINKVEVSIYGGFFYDQSTARYYQLPRALINDWLNYIVQNMKAIKQ
jgi:hypothetical protein